jgi:hypothetical protein
MTTNRLLLFLLLLATGGLATACASAGTTLPPPRPLIIYSGERLRIEPDRAAGIDAWVRDEMLNIQEDPSFLLIGVGNDQPVYLWEQLELVSEDSVKVGYESGVPDIRTPYEIYAHLHLMAEIDRQEEWLPEAPDATGYALERAIVQRVSDTWLYGRSIYEATPYPLLDELIYAVENGFLDAYIFTARPDEFQEERRQWLADNPAGMEEYRSWFVDVFGRQPPGLRESAAG